MIDYMLLSGLVRKIGYNMHFIGIMKDLIRYNTDTGTNWSHLINIY